MCISDDTLSLSDRDQERVRRLSKDRYWQSIEPGSEFVVYGLAIFHDVLCYILHGTLVGSYPRDYPMTYPACFFSVVDARLPDNLHVLTDVDRLPKGVSLLVVPRRWAMDPDFYSRVVDGEPKAREEWEVIRRVIDAQSIG